jgi:hypothetical protein
MGQSTSLCRLPSHLFLVHFILLHDEHMHDIECPRGTMRVFIHSSDSTRLPSSSSLEFVLEDADDLRSFFF